MKATERAKGEEAGLALFSALICAPNDRGAVRLNSCRLDYGSPHAEFFRPALWRFLFHSMTSGRHSRVENESASATVSSRRV